MARKRMADCPLPNWDLAEIKSWLFERHGPLIGGRDLVKALGYPTAAALRQAEVRNALPVRVFEIEGRRGRFAFTDEVATWLAELRLQTSPSHPDTKKGGQT